MKLQTTQRIWTKAPEQLLSLIDIKTNSEMEKVLNKLDSMEKSMSVKLESIEKSLNARITALYWFLGAITIFISILKFIQ